MNIPDELAGSTALQFVISRGWQWKVSTLPNIELETCPFCQKTGYSHFYMECHGANSESKQRDGLCICHKCGKGGSLYSLKQHLGVAGIAGVESRKDWSGGQKEIEPLPDVDACHQALLEDEDALDYLMNGRGFSREIIERQKIGIVPKRYFRETGEVKALVYPYLVNGNVVFCHYRTLPTMPLSENKVPKAFSSPKGWEVPLYNQEVLRPGLKEVTMVEGEPNVVAAMDKGIEDICGIPGANIKKAEWIDVLDTLELDRHYICFDKDKVGHKAAQALASRIGVEKCWKITLPDFTVTTEEGETRPGKDLNEWFVSGGGSAEAFEQLKQDAVLFDVDGVASSKDAVQEFLDELEGKEGGLEPKYRSQWGDLNKLVGFDDGDVIDILAPEKVGKTTFALNLVEHMVDTYGEDGVVICLEMMRARMARKWICLKSGVEDNIPKTPEEAILLKQAFLEAIPQVQEMAANREGDLYFCYPKYKTDDDLYQLIIEIIRRYGVKWIVIDNLQRWADTTPQGKGNRTEHLSTISKVTSQIAKDYGVQMIRILQPHRIADGKIVSSNNTDGSSQIAKDCDCTIILHREPANPVSKEMLETMVHVESEESFSPNMLVNVPLTRYSGGGYTTLLYDGARSTVTERDDIAKAKVQAAASKDVGYHNVLKTLTIATSSTPVAGEGGVYEGEITV